MTPFTFDPSEPSPEQPQHLRLASILWASLALLVIGCSKSPPKPPALSETAAKDSHARMISVLKVLESESERTNIYFNGATKIEGAKATLADAVADGNIVDTLEAHRVVGLHELNLGNSRVAAEHFAESCKLVDVVREKKLASISSEAEQGLLLKCAVAYLRLAEDQNCVLCTNGKSCILPIVAEGVHQDREGSEKAIEYLNRILAMNDRHATAAWLLNVAAMTLGEYPQRVPEQFRIDPNRFVSQSNFPAFPNIASNLGLDTLSHAGGAIADDFDGDHLIDIVVSNFHPAGELKFFRNLGNGKFADQSEQANFAGITGGLNIIHADYDNDGDLDVFVLRGAWLGREDGKHPNSLLQNDGTGRFVDVTFAVGLADVHYPTQTAGWQDFDLDGDLDLYVGNEHSPCQLFQNDGSGRFTDIAKSAGVDNGTTFTKAVSWGDYDGDRWPDLYVSNLHEANALFRNKGDGSFENRSRQLDVQSPKDSFASWFWDYNNDGKLDLFASSYTVGAQYIGLDYLGVGTFTEHDCLYENLGNGTFREVSADRNLLSVTQPMGCNYGDLDNDGYLDFYLATGYPGYDGLMPNVMYRNRGGEQFEDVTFAGGFGHLQKGHGVAFADFDHDGDQDIFTELGGAYPGDDFYNALFANPGFGRHWIKVKLVGTQSNRSAIGARIKLEFQNEGEPRTVYRWVSSGSSFGGNPLRQEIGLGDAQKVDRMEVYWPMSDQLQSFTDLDVDQLIEVTEGEPTPRKIPIRVAAFDLSDSAASQSHGESSGSAETAKTESPSP